jgi:hypothetical protein
MYEGLWQWCFVLCKIDFLDFAELSTVTILGLIRSRSLILFSLHKVIWTGNLFRGTLSETTLGGTGRAFCTDVLELTDAKRAAV